MRLGAAQTCRRTSCVPALYCKELIAEPGLAGTCTRAEDFRERVLAQTRNPALVARLAPRLPGEADAARRGRALYAQLEQALGLRTQPLLQVRAAARVRFQP